MPRTPTAPIERRPVEFSEPAVLERLVIEILREPAPSPVVRPGSWPAHEGERARFSHD